MSIRVVDPTCSECERPIGPECRKGMTAAQLRDAMTRAAERDDPFRIPEERPASTQARVNNHNARAMADPDAVQLCRHENRVGACGDCRREADPWRAAERILREVRAESYPVQRAELVRVVSARWAHITPWTPPVRPPAARTAATPPRDRQRRHARPTGQLELL